MKCQRLYIADDNECMLWRRIEEAFNLLAEFAPELRWQPQKSMHEVMPPAKKAYHRVIDNKQFTWEDYETLREYMHTVASRADTKYLEAKVSPIRTQVLRNSHNMWGVAADLNALMNSESWR